MILYKDLPEIFKFFTANGYMLHQYKCGFGWCFNNGYNIFFSVREKENLLYESEKYYYK